MKIEFVTSTIGIGTEMHISASEYKRVCSEEDFNDKPNMLFAVKSYVIANQCINSIKGRDLEEAFRHVKKTGTIILITKTNGNVNWCELYAITENDIIPVITSNNGREFNINYSNKTIHEIKKRRKGE